MNRKKTALLCAAAFSAVTISGGFITSEQYMAEETQTAADHTAELIDAIYVQQRTDRTDAECAEAKKAWDELTDEEKEQVEGVFADSDYFGRDTGDASLDDPRNGDEIGENELLVVSFGTSFNDSRVKDIKAIEDRLQEENPDWSVRRAFTAQIIINHIQARDGEYIDNMQQALERSVKNHVKNLVIQPTHLMHGAEYDELMETVEAYQEHFETVKVAEPLLGEASDDASTVNDDKKLVAEAVVLAAAVDAGYDNIAAVKENGTAIVLLGHGTAHIAKVTYSQMQKQMEELGYDQVFVGTVEGEPEGTSCEDIINDVAEAGYKHVILRPLMVVAGDHANNDMAGDDDESWKSQFLASGRFESVEEQISGLGSIGAIQDLYAAHTAAVMSEAADVNTEKNQESKEVHADVPDDGEYLVDFETDSSMFHVNEACSGKGKLTVENGKMKVHISLPSKNIVNLYAGLAAEAEQDGAKLLSPTNDTVVYDDGTQEEVYGFDVPVQKLNEEFDLALIGTKGVWYDHKVCVSNPEKTE